MTVSTYCYSITKLSCTRNLLHKSDLFSVFHLFEGWVSLEEICVYNIISVNAKNKIKVFKSLFVTINSLWLLKSSRPLWLLCNFCNRFILLWPLCIVLVLHCGRSHLDVTQNCFIRLFDPGQGTWLQPPWLLHSHLQHPPLLRVTAQFPQGWIHPSCPLTRLLHLHPSCHAYSPALTLLPQTSTGPGLRPPITACQAASPNGVRCQSAQWLKLKPRETPAPLLFCLFCLSLPFGRWHRALSRDGRTGLRE